MLWDCLLGVLILSFGVAFAFAVMAFVFAALNALAAAGPVGFAGVEAAVVPILLAAGAIFLGSFIIGALSCLLAAAQAGEVGAGAAGDAAQAQEEQEQEDERRYWVKCRLCRWLQNYIAPTLGPAAIVAYFLAHYGK
jgi:hypothetical protein